MDCKRNTAVVPERWALRCLLGDAVVLALVIYAANVWFGSLNQDEGWYLYAALETAAGRRPHADFFFTQGPVMPWVYGRLSPLWAGFGVLGGRILTALLGLFGAGLAAWVAARMTSKEQRLPAAITAFLLLGGNVYHSYFTTIPKTYALSVVLLMGAMLALTRVRGRDLCSGAAAAGAGIALAAASAVRISLGAALAVSGFWLLASRRRFGWAWLFYGMAGIGTLALAYGPTLSTAWFPLRYSLGFHAAREGGSGFDALLFVAGSVSRTVRGYYPMCLLAIGWGVVYLIRGSSRSDRTSDESARTLQALPMLLSFVAVVCVHLLSPHPYDDYQTPVFPLLASLLSADLWKRVPSNLPPRALGWSSRVWALIGLWLACAAAAFASPINQDWFIIRQDRFWVRRKPVSDLALLRKAGRWIRARTPPDALILTQDAYLAVEAGRRLPPGFEMGPFGFFPEMDSAMADRLHVLNNERMAQTIATAEAPIAAVSGYGFALHAPEMREIPEAERDRWIELLSERYKQIERIPDFGQQHTELTLWIRRQ